MSAFRKGHTALYRPLRGRLPPVWFRIPDQKDGSGDDVPALSQAPLESGGFYQCRRGSIFLGSASPAKLIRYNF